jgi:hypothetical protein
MPTIARGMRLAPEECDAHRPSTRGEVIVHGPWPERKPIMRSFRFAAFVASAVALQLTACSSSSAPAPVGAQQGDGGVTADTGPASVCPAIIGHWLATLDQGAEVTLQGTPVPITGTVDFTLTRDDGDLANIVDFNGNATITFAGQTVTQRIQPATSPSGDPKDTTCDGGLHLRGQASIAGMGDILFTIDGTLDTTVTPTTGKGTFAMKTLADDGGTATANGPLHMVHQ